MKKRILITMPAYDDVTEYFSYYSKEIIKKAKENNISVWQLSNKDATKEKFESAINDSSFNFIIINGHGNSKEIFGQNEEVILAENANEQLLADKITYARACEAGASLGKSIVSSKKGGCFIGYELPFQFYVNQTWVGNPLKDNIARIFFEPSNAVPIFLINGKTTIVSHESSKNMIIKSINRVLRNLTPESLAIAEALWNNYEGQVLHGNYDAKI